jgi:hypothetical protein
MKKYRAFSFLIFFLLAGYTPIEVFISLEKAIKKNSSVENKEIEIEKLKLQEKGCWNKHIPTGDAAALYSYI